MKSRIRLSLSSIVIGLSFGAAVPGCLHNVRDEANATITIENVQLDGQTRIKDDGWVEVKRMKARADHTTFMSGIAFTRTDLVIKDLIDELAYPPVPQWMVLRGALVIDGLAEEVSDLIDNGFHFHRKVILYANVSKIISLSVRLLPSGRPALIGFMLSQYQLPENTHLVHDEPSIENEIVVIHPASNEDSQQ